MAQPYCSGPVAAYVGPGSYSAGGMPGPAGGGVAFLGHNQRRGPRISIRRAWEPVFSDISGTRIPYDLIYEGQEAYVTIEFSRYNMAVIGALANIPNNLGGVDMPFTDVGGTRGTIMLTEGVAVGLVLTFPFSITGPTPHVAMSNAANGALPSGFYFPGAIYEGPDEWEPGTAPLTITVTFHCLGVFALPSQDFILATTVLPTLPPIN